MPKKNKNTESYFLDTSFLIKLLNFDEHTADRLLSVHANGTRFACYYTLIEFNTGFISAAITFYNYVIEMKDVASALTRTGNMFSRGTKYTTLIHAALIRAHTKIDTSDYLVFADLLESTIVNTHIRTLRAIKHFIGEYQKNLYSIQNISSREDFERFPAYNTKNTRPSLSEIWLKNEENIKVAKAYMLKLKSTKKLKKIESDYEILLDLVISNPTLNISHIHKSDLAISLEAPKNQTVIAYDELFDTSIPSLAKNGGYVKLPPY